MNGERLIPDAFEAWVHGPALPALWERFSCYRWNPISEDVPEHRFPDEVENHLREVMEAYGGFTTWDMERLTHAEDPWLLARGDSDPHDPTTNVISEEEMKRFYAMRAAA